MSIATTAPLAIILASYRKQEDRYGLSFPPSISSAIYERLLRTQFYKTKTRYEVIVLHSNNGCVMLETKYSYEVHNRTNEPAVWNAKIDPVDPDFTICGISMGGKPLIKDDPRYRTGRGLEIVCQIAVGGSQSFYFHFISKYNVVDSELFTTYNPADSLELKMISRNDNLILSFDVLSDQEHNVHPIESDSGRQIVLKNGVLPFQGIRMKWFPKKGDQNGTRR